MARCTEDLVISKRSLIFKTFDNLFAIRADHHSVVGGVHIDSFLTALVEHKLGRLRTNIRLLVAEIIAT